MKAAQLKNTDSIRNNPLKITDIPKPESGKEELLLKVKACGICHTDLHTVEGDLDLPKLPVVLGHQVAAEVAETGENVNDFEAGDTVGVPWLYSTCGKCEYCLDGKENLCENARFTGLHVDGGFEEFLISKEKFTYKLPEEYTYPEVTPLLCGGVIGYRAFRLSEAEENDRLGLYGFGNSAHITIQIANYTGCETYVFTRSENHQKHARRLGARWIGTSKDDPGVKMNASIMFAPAGPLVLDALSHLDKGGTLALAGIHMTPIPELNYEKHLYYEKTLRSVANSTRRDVRELLDIAQKADIKTTVETFGLEEVNRSLQLMKDSELSGDGVIVL